MLVILFLSAQLFLLVYPDYRPLNQEQPFHHYQGLQMASLATIQQTHDPKATLSGEELVSLLMEYCNTQIRENAKSEREIAKDIINDKIDIVVKGFGDAITTVANTLNEHITAQTRDIAELSRKINHLEKQNRDLHEAEEKITEINLKTETYGVYHEQLLNNLKLGIQDSLHRVYNDIKILSSQANSCIFCGYEFDSPRGLRHHIQTHHHTTTQNTCQRCCEQPQYSTAGLPDCKSCGRIFKTIADLNLHTYHEHGATCGLEYTTDHISRNRDFPAAQQTSIMSCMLNCDQCTYICSSQTDLSNHMRYNHKQGIKLHCNKCERTFSNIVILNTHIKQYHGLNSCSDHATPTQTDINPSLENASGLEDISCGGDDMEEDDIISDTDVNDMLNIPQMDGNDSLGSLQSYSVSSPRGQGGVPPANSIQHCTNSQDLTFNYSLNNEHQANRMIAGATRPSLSVTYNNIQTIQGIQYALFATVECNSGVYLTAIKPALQAVTNDWSMDINGWVVSCTSVSNRQDNTGTHLLSTQLKLIISNQDSTVSHHITLHFYHTNDKILIQSSTVILPGMSAATWLVKHFIEPLTATHVATNQQSIDQINNAILSSSVSQGSWSCSFCFSKISLTATKVKEQPLTCKNCNNVFHKKCTNRSSTRGSNWNREPWVCPSCTTSDNQACIPPNNPPNQLPLSRQSPVLLTSPSNLEQLSLHEETDTSIIDTHPATSRTPDISSLPPPPPAPSITVVNSSPATTRRFPNNSIRQRNSNVAVMSPDQEFTKAALDACRSTITQQEADIRTLKESLDIRNKKVMQLESQVGVAKSYLASSVLPPVHTGNPTIEQPDCFSTNINLVIAKLNSISDKLCSKSNTVNVYNSSCPHQKLQTSDKSVQTCLAPNPTSGPTNAVMELSTTDKDDSILVTSEEPPDTEIILTCTLCQESFQSSSDLDSHMDRIHGNDCSTSTSRGHRQPNPVTCELCSNTFLTKKSLNLHISKSHAADYFSCQSCKLRFQGKPQLDTHIAECHSEQSVVPPTSPTVPSTIFSNSSALSPQPARL